MLYPFRLALFLPLALAINGSVFGQYTAVTLPSLVGTTAGFNTPGAIDSLGQVVGSASNADLSIIRAYVYRNGVLTDLGSLGGVVVPGKQTVFSTAGAINSSGQIVGGSLIGDDPLNSVRHAVLYSNGVITDLGTLGGTSSVATGINNAGQIVGVSSTATDHVNHGFLISEGKMIDLGPDMRALGINDAGQIIGTLNLPDFSVHAFLWTGGVIKDLGTLGGMNSAPTGVNNSGQVTGQSDTPPGVNLPHHAFLFSDGVMQDLGDFGGGLSTATGINAGGDVVGSAYFTPKFSDIAQFIYHDGKMTNVTSLLPGPYTILGINKAGQLIASLPTTGTFPAILTPPPAIGPSIDSGGIVPNAGSSNYISPGSWVSIYGKSLAAAPATWKGEFPTTLGDVTVTIDGVKAFLWFVSPTQINLQIPDTAKRGRVDVVVTNSLGKATAPVMLAPVSPSFNSLDGKYLAGVIPTPDGSGAYGGGSYDIAGPAGSFAYATRPVKQGEVIELYGTGFGPTSPTVAPGTAFNGSALSTFPVTVTIGGVKADVSYSGMIANGLFQFNVTVPKLTAGDRLVQARVNGVGTIYGFLPVQ